MASTSWSAYKTAKEEWIAHQSGGSVAHINAVCGVTLASLALCVLVDRQPLWWRTCVHGAVLILPLLAACTVLAERLVWLYALLGTLIGIYYLASTRSGAVPRQKRSPAPAGRDAVGADKPPGQPLGFLTAYRAYMMIITVICILAVDFGVFPRAFAKCESWGTSLMDLGVGSFVVSHGTVSIGKRAWRKTVRRMLPLLVLGAVRVALVKGTEYPEHVSEYGVHWNFFITLALVLPALDAAQRLVPAWLLAPAGFALSALYEVALRGSPLGAWALSDARAPDLFSRNKEGIASMPGYLALGLVGLDIGHVVRAGGGSDSRRRLQLQRALLRRAIAWWAIYVAVQAYLAPSRRLANLPYVLWVSAFNASFVLGFRAVLDGLGADVPALLERINARSLIVFLLANVATGVVNLSLRTMECSAPVALGVLLVYVWSTLVVLPVVVY